MPRNMSFFLTTEQVLSGTKTVTRRAGWKFLKSGDRLNAVEKCQGLKKGEKVVKLRDLIVVEVRREPLVAITADDVAREGFPEWSTEDFIGFYCGESGTRPDDEVTRIEFSYIDAANRTFRSSYRSPNDNRSRLPGRCKRTYIELE